MLKGVIFTEIHLDDSTSIWNAQAFGLEEIALLSFNKNMSKEVGELL